MKRREFIGLLGGAAAAWPLATQAQQVGKVVRVGWMSRGNRAMPDPTMDAFRGGMRERGYAEGQSFVIEARYADGKSELMPEQAAELERSGVDVIVAGPFEALQAAKRSTLRVPHHYRRYSMAGGLMSYGIDIAEQFRQGASYIDRILKG
jgi:putative ABC transport system substrate-binding protein